MYWCEDDLKGGYVDVYSDDELLELVENANPNHDDLGRFSTGSGSYATMTPVEFEASAIRDYGSQVEWTDKQKTAIDFYTGMYYREINAHLNGKHIDSTKNFEFPTNESGIKTLDEGVKVLDSSMKNTLKKNTDLYRGYTTKYDLTPGMELRYKGYSSASFFPSVGEKFAKENAKYKFDDAYRPIVLKIKAKKGQKGIIPITEGSDSGLRGVEAEFILPRNTTVKINKITDKGDYEEAEVSIQ